MILSPNIRTRAAELAYRHPRTGSDAPTEGATAADPFDIIKYEIIIINMAESRTYTKSILVDCNVIHGRPWLLAQRAIEKLGDGYAVQVCINEKLASMRCIVNLMLLEASRGETMSYTVTAFGDGKFIDSNIQRIVDDAFAKAARGVQYIGDE